MTEHQRQTTAAAATAGSAPAARAGAPISLPATPAALRADPRRVVALQRQAGNRATARALRGAWGHVKAGARRLARLGYPLGVPLPAGAPTPMKDEADHREWNKNDFHAFWEQEQGRKLKDSEKKTIDRGCIGITANNLEGAGNPSLVEVYDDFATAHAAMKAHNSTWWNTHVSDSKYVMFGMLFWSNQNPDKAKRNVPDPGAFRGDPVTRKIDMAGYKYREKPGGVNFDYGFWDDSTASFWHANHKEFGPVDPMIVYQSTRNRFATPYPLADGTTRYGYAEFDRVAYGVAVANNYDPTKGTPKPAATPAPAPAAPANPYDMGPTFPF